MVMAMIRKVAPRAISPSFRIMKLVQKRTGRSIIGGPFRGLKYIDQSIGSAYIPKLLGTYERELQPTLRKVVSSSPDTILDIGAAEGYYAVGLATICKARIVAFECVEAGRKLMHQFARQNDSPRNLQVEGLCTPEALRITLNDAGRAVILMDVEGAEDSLLDPRLIPRLKATQIIVEMHDFIVPGVTDRIIARFAQSHIIERIDQEPRSAQDLPFTNSFPDVLKLFPKRYLDWAVSEHRPVKMHWLHLTPRMQTAAHFDSNASGQ